MVEKRVNTSYFLWQLLKKHKQRSQYCGHYRGHMSQIDWRISPMEFLWSNVIYSL